MPAPAATMPVSRELDAALADLLIRLADDELIIGHRNSEWTGLGPILEADIAFSSMAQDEMGHALAYYRLLHDLGRPDPDELAFARPAGQFRCASLVALEKGDWAFSLVRQFLYDAAESVRIDALAKCSYAPLAALARKIHGEEKYHLMHGRTWFVHLGRATPDSRARMQAALDRAYPHALGLFESTPQDKIIAKLGVQPTETALRDEWQRRIEPVVIEAELKLPRSAQPVFGGRSGRHPPEFAKLIDDMQKVYRLDPKAKW